ncbi:MAG: methylmalonyl Co-A mutase-associated GTPase MeaB, partial [Lewinella sp.]|nr:methylmalonyl Co-A mutase-associated GTPase MeaB [Lewinella sp.]
MPHSLNPQLPPRRRSRRSADDYVQGVLSGDRVVLSQAVTLVESTLPADREQAHALLDACLPHTGRSFRLGITGVPGVGKSTFIEAFGLELLAAGYRLAVLTIDPSSQLTRGSILGDKTRMARLAQREEAYIRPSAAGDALGGVAAKTRELILLCEAAGFDFIIVETVGVGQSEVAVHALTDFFLLLLLPGGGDELQGIKRGVVEMADLIAVNKADGERTAAARQARVEYARALHLFPPKPSGWTARAVTCSATTGAGVA